MKKIIGLTFAAIVIVVGFSVNSFAQTRHYRNNIERRENNERRRINQGIRSGSLTRKEARRLEKQQVRVDRAEDKYRRSGGGLSRSERAKLERRYNHASRYIYKQKHDKQHTGYIRRTP